jgi:lipopolysaccharide export system protein LptA
MPPTAPDLSSVSSSSKAPRLIVRTRLRGFLAAVAGGAILAAPAQNLGLDLTGEGEDAEDSGTGGLFSGGLLPNGSILRNAVLPSYDGDYNLASVVNAGELVIHTRDEAQVDKRTGKDKTVAVLDRIDARDVEIRFFAPDRRLTGSIAMTTAEYRISKKINLLTSKEPVSFVSEDMKVNGSAFAFDTDKRRGFLHGPVTAEVQNRTDTRTSMNAKSARGALAGTLLLAAAPLATGEESAPAGPGNDAATEAAPLTPAERLAAAKLSPADRARLDADLASRRALLAAESAVAAAVRERVETDGRDARLSMNGFFRRAALVPLMAQPAAEAPLPDVPRPPELAAGPDTVTTSVSAKDGAYFDTEKGLLVFLGDVKVKNPEISLDGANEVKLFLEPAKKEEENAEKAAAAPKKEPKEITPEMAEQMLAAKLRGDGKKNEGEAGGRFGDVKKMVATGPAVHIRYVSGKPDDPPIEAMAHSIVYNSEKGTILLEGGSPWAIQEGVMRAEAVGKDAYILIYADKDGEMTRVVTHNPNGGFNANLQSNKLKEDDKKKKPAQAQPNR